MNRCEDMISEVPFETQLLFNIARNKLIDWANEHGYSRRGDESYEHDPLFFYIFDADTQIDIRLYCSTTNAFGKRTKWYVLVQLNPSDCREDSYELTRKNIPSLIKRVEAKVKKVLNDDRIRRTAAV